MSQAETLKERIAEGSYRVDPNAVADAIIARHGPRQGLQLLCSEMLVAPHISGEITFEREPFTGNDAA